MLAVFVVLSANNPPAPAVKPGARAPQNVTLIVPCVLHDDS